VSEGADRETHGTLRRLQHELRTPLGQIIGYSELLSEEVAERGQDDLQQDLERIRGAAHRLLGLLDATLQPVAAQAPEPARAQAPEPSAAPAREAAGARILVVDDDPANRDLLGRRLGRRGYAVELAEGGREALHRIEADPPDVILLDVLMPELDGFAVLAAIRRQHSPAQLPVILATSLAGSEDVARGLESGANDYVTKPFDEPVVLARVEAQLRLRRAAREVESLARQLELRNAFIRRTFGRYVSDEVVSELLESPAALELGGARRRVAILLADLRGFSALTESLAPGQVVALLNNHLGTMVDVILEHGGTIGEFIGDGILGFFGAPVARDDDTERAVACAIHMQRAMEQVNALNQQQALPPVEMGIGIDVGEVVAGSIGSERRSQYTCIGSAVNLAARIESYSLGGEIWISHAARAAVETLVRIDAEREVHPKGFESPLRIHRVAGLGGRHGASLPRDAAELVELREPVPVRLAVLAGKQVAAARREARIVALSANAARLRTEEALEELCDLRLELHDEGGVLVPEACYAKVVSGGNGEYTLRFTARPPAAAARLEQALVATGR
jgi:class 3 adenylate cyclase